MPTNQTTDTLQNDEAASRSGSRLSLILRALEVWLVISVVEIIHGAVRIAALQPLVGDFRARQIAVFTGSLLIIATTFFFRRWLCAASVSDCLIVGAAWVVLTLGFEFLLGRGLSLSWERILSDYDLARGGLMPIGLTIMFFSPLIVSRVPK